MIENHNIFINFRPFQNYIPRLDFSKAQKCLGQNLVKSGMHGHTYKESSSIRVFCLWYKTCSFQRMIENHNMFDFRTLQTNISWLNFLLKCKNPIFGKIGLCHFLTLIDFMQKIRKII